MTCCRRRRSLTGGAPSCSRRRRPRWKRSSTIQSDKPLELLGSNQAPNPQELLMATSPNFDNMARAIALNAALVVA